MSLHRYIVPPPLALAVHPAPAPKPKEPEKEGKEKQKGKEKEKDAEDKAKDGGKDKGNENEKGNKDEKDKAGDAGQPEEQGKDKQAEEEKAEHVKAVDPAAGDEEEPAIPATPGSMTPEPPTPAPGAKAVEVDEEAKVGKTKAKGGEADKANDDVDVDDKDAAQAQVKDQKAGGDKKGLSIKDMTPEPEPGTNAAKKADPGVPAEGEGEAEAEPKPDPIRLLPPAPPRPIRTRLDLNPSKPYPPVNTDPRGAYNKYAKAVGAEWILIDVTKDGWLVEQWKERSEREALKRLTGEWEKELEREMERQRKKAEIRPLPKTAEGILLELWNELAEANNHEIAAEEFWNRYDWTQESAKVHLSDRRVVEGKEKPEGSEAEDKVDADADADAAEGGGEGEGEVEWTKAGVEEILATVGIQCAYNTVKPLQRSYYEPPSAYLLMSHSYFLLRNDMRLVWKPEQVAGQFEVLVTSGHDRVFGAMVKAQREKEYRERKEREKKERAEKEKGQGKEGDKGDEKKEAKDRVDNKDAGEKKEDKANKDLATPDPGTPSSNIKLIDGEPVAPAAAAGDQVKVGKADEGAAAVAIVDPKNDVAMVALPVNAKAPEGKEDMDAKHEKEAVIVPSPRPAVKDIDAEKQTAEAGKDVNANINAIANAQAQGKGKDKEVEKPMNMGQIAQAFQALEAANDPKPVDPDAAPGPGEGKKARLIWTWAERCEMWRWKNYEAGAHDIAPGGWEERDWKVFADDREVWDYEADEAVVEDEEEDVHDWSI